MGSRNRSISLAALSGAPLNEVAISCHKLPSEHQQPSATQVHSLFLEGQQLIIPVAEVDQACKEPAKYDSPGSLVLEYETF